MSARVSLKKHVEAYARQYGAEHLGTTDLKEVVHTIILDHKRLFSAGGFPLCGCRDHGGEHGVSPGASSGKQSGPAASVLDEFSALLDV